MITGGDWPWGGRPGAGPRAPLPAGPDQLFPPSAAYTLNLSFCRRAFSVLSPPPACWAFFFLTLLPFAVEIAPAEPAAASLSALLHSSSTKQQINSVATRREGWGVGVGGVGGGGVLRTPRQSHFQTVAMETPLSFPT